MRILACVVCLIVLFTPAAYSDVRLQGNLVIQDSSLGAKILGEVLNDTDETIKSVRVDVTIKDTSGNVLEEELTFVAGYRQPGSSSHALIPSGRYAPFRIWSSFEPEQIGSCDVSFTYSTTDVELPDLSLVTLESGPYITGNFLGARFRGNILNNATAHIYGVRVLIAVKDADGRLLGYDYDEICGEDYLSPDSDYYCTLIQPDSYAPFDITVSCEDYGEIATYYRIISYEVGEEGAYEYYGKDQVGLDGDISASDDWGDLLYEGAIANNTGCDLYNVSVTIITRNADGKIIDIDSEDVEGTSYETPDGDTTNSHIAPGGTAPFTLDTKLDYANFSTFDYIINYRYDPEGVYVEEDAPLAFTLGQNYPNPFNPRTAISFTLPQAATVRLDVYNVGGQLVEELLDTRMQAGYHVFDWDASRLPSGVYFYTLSANGQMDRRKMTLVK